MRKILIAIVILALISIPPIAGTVAAQNPPAAPNPVDIVPVIQPIDPAAVPKSDPPTSMAVGAASTYNIYPNTVSVNVYYTLSDTWYDEPFIAVLAPQATGTYAFTVWVHLTNPSHKWACACFPPDVIPTPSNIVSKFSQLWSSYNTWYLYPDAANLTWSGQNLLVYEIQVSAIVTSTSGVFNIAMTFNQMHTDLNNNGRVDLGDLVLLANAWLRKYTPDLARNDPMNIVMDPVVDYFDLAALSYEYGRTIPP
jgi:hypothetical protein